MEPYTIMEPLAPSSYMEPYFGTIKLHGALYHHGAFGTIKLHGALLWDHQATWSLIPSWSLWHHQATWSLTLGSSSYMRPLGNEFQSQGLLQQLPKCEVRADEAARRQVQRASPEFRGPEDHIARGSKYPIFKDSGPKSH